MQRTAEVTDVMIVDPEIYLKPIRDAEPCGEPLDYDLSFLELEMAARGKPGQELGSAVIAPEPPNWSEVIRLAAELSTRSKDLRIALLVVRAALNIDGLAGFGHALEILAVYVERYWPGLHPRPDPEDGDDQTVRLNALANLCDPEGLLDELRRVPLTQSRMFGNFSLRDWVEAQRSAAAGGLLVDPDVVTIENSFRDTARDVLEASSAAFGTMLGVIARLDEGTRAHVGIAQAISFDPLIELLLQMRSIVDEHRTASAADIPSEVGAVPDATAYPQEIRDRNDIVGILDRICRWYRTNEPASPVPVLLERAKRLVARDFMALLLELAPEGVAQFRALAGLTADGEARGN
jgi:type VI secretion system protein ImpA